MNEKTITEIFKMIAQTKYFNKTKYELDGEDLILLYDYYKIYKVYKHATFSRFKKAVINYSLIKTVSLHSSAEVVCKKLFTK